MSPDPPREDTGDDDNSNRIRRFSGEFMEGLMDDEFFIVPDAPYELDMEQESDYTDSDEDSPARMEAQNAGSQSGEVTTAQASEQEFSFQGQGRGRYRLLIPFPVDNSTTTSSDTAQSNNLEGEGEGANNTTQSGMEEGGANLASPGVEGQISDGASMSSSHAGQENDSTPQIKSPVTDDDVKTREIDLSEEKVETIKQVMKKIILPVQAVPTWAWEVDEDAWTRKLHDAIGSGSSNKSSRSHDARDSKQQDKTESEGAKE